jgi:hypothetical protein
MIAELSNVDPPPACFFFFSVARVNSARPIDVLPLHLPIFDWGVSSRFGVPLHSFRNGFFTSLNFTLHVPLGHEAPLCNTVQAVYLILRRSSTATTLECSGPHCCLLLPYRLLAISGRAGARNRAFSELEWRISPTPMVVSLFFCLAMSGQCGFALCAYHVVASLRSILVSLSRRGSSWTTEQLCCEQFN